jgi:hypothetical protein
MIYSLQDRCPRFLSFSFARGLLLPGVHSDRATHAHRFCVPFSTAANAELDTLQIFLLKLSSDPMKKISYSPVLQLNMGDRAMKFQRGHFPDVARTSSSQMG